MSTTPNPSPGMSLRQAFIETLRDGEDTGKAVMSLIGSIAGAVTAHLTHLEGKDGLIAISAGSLVGWAYGKDVWEGIFRKKNTN